MKDRLRRWLTPVVIDRIRRGTHGRADATGPCRGCATAASCRAAIVGRPMAACNICVGCNLDRIARCADVTARTRHWGVAEFQVAGSSCSRAEQTHPMRIARRVPRLAGSPAGANRPAEAALCLESCARISLGARCPSEICRIRRFRSARTAGQYQDGLRRSDATDRSPLYSG